MRERERSERVAACVLAHNPPDGLSGVLEYVRAQSRHPDAVLVVDNASDPAIDASGWPGSWTLMRLGANEGVGAGHNLGVKWARDNGFDRAWLLEHDDLPVDTCLERLEGHAADLDRDSRRWGVIYPKNVRNLDEAARIGTESEPPDEKFALDDSLDMHPSALLKRASRFTFNGPLVNVDELLEAGGVREDLFVGHEDWELSRRMTNAGAELYYARDAILVHTNKAAKPASQVSPLRLYYSSRNMVRLSLEDGRSPVVLLARAALSALTLSLRGLPRHGRARFVGAWDGWRGRMGRTW